MSCDFANKRAEAAWHRWALGLAVVLMALGGAAASPWSGGVWAVLPPVPGFGAGLGPGLMMAAALLALAVAVSARRTARARAAAARRADAVMAMLEHEDEARLLLDGDGRPVLANAAARRLWPSLSPAEDTRARLFDPQGLVGLEQGGDRLERLAAAARAGYGDRVTLALQPIDGTGGEPEWWDITLRLLDADGHRLTLWQGRDVTARHAIDEVMAREREALSDFLYFLPVGLVSVDTEGRLRFVNQRMARWLDRSVEDLRQASLADIVDGRPPPPADGAWQGEMRFRAGDGESFAALVSQASFDDGGDLITRTVVLRDAAPAAEQGEGEPYDGADRRGAATGADRRVPGGGPWRWDRMFRWLFDGAPVGIILTDPEGCLTDCNRALEHLCGKPRDDLVDRPLPDLFAEADRPDVARVMDQVLRGIITEGEQIDVALDDGEDREGGGRPVTAALFLGPMGGRRTGPHGVPVEGVIAHLIDTSEQRSLERQFAQAQKMQAMGQLAGGVAHDFNNLLTAMIGYSDLLLQRHGTGDPSFADIMQIRQNANRAANLVRQLLAFSRRQPLQPRAMNVGAALSELSHLLRRLLGETVKLDLVHGRDVDYVRADPGQFDQVIINLAVNARDAMPDGGTLTIATRVDVLDRPLDRGVETMPAGEYVVVEIRDTGKGIPPEHLARIFEPFFTTKGGGAVGTGTGLGLSTVYGILRQTGGFVDVQSAPGEGTTFSLHLPRARSDQPSGDGPTAEATADPSGSGSPETADIDDLSGAATILLVEDEAPVRAFALRALRNKGYTVLEATTGEAALEILAQTEAPAPALLITDMIMPGIDGATLARQAQAERPDLRVIIISGYSEDAARGDILQRPHVHFLPKPFSLKLLAETVKSVLSEP
jgi:two-component system cell cycle sensor histidine kinase/response regulator CckA